MFGHDDQDENRDEGMQQTPHDTAVAPNEDQGMAANDDSSQYVATPAAPATTPPPAATDDLLDIKQEALQALTPLVGQLDQTPEEQFRTTMMMIQASDNHSLVKVAYEAAKQIPNEKERAQALLDIVNEINYFTQHVQS